ncbi:MAG: peptidylprolyl isomerase [Anaerolineales bacterium]|nr:peptidylprolyl isomerase [Anaerolineales bacterium]
MRFYLTLLLVFGLSACASLGTSSTPTPAIPTDTPLPPSPTPPPSVAMVNGEYITQVEFEAELNRYKTVFPNIEDAQARQIVLDDLIAQFLLSQAARKENFEVTEADLQLRIDALGSPDSIAQWQSSHGYDETSFRIALKRSIESAWMRDKIIADIPNLIEQIHLRQILTYNEGDAQLVMQNLNAGQDFDELAAMYDPITKGELGWVPQGYLLDANADQAVFALQAGEVSDIISTDAGFHIFKVIERGEHELTPDALLTVQALTLKNWIAEQKEKSEIVLLQ